MYRTFASAMRSIIHAGLASTYQEASARYSDQMVFAQCNMVTTESLNRIIDPLTAQKPEGAS